MCFTGERYFAIKSASPSQNMGTNDGGAPKKVEKTTDGICFQAGADNQTIQNAPSQNTIVNQTPPASTANANTNNTNPPHLHV